MKRITYTVNMHGYILRICYDEELEVLIVDPKTPQDRVYRWRSLHAGREHVDAEIDGWPIGNLTPRAFANQHQSARELA